MNTLQKGRASAQGEALPKINHPLAYMVPIHEQHFGGELTLTVSARELHSFLEVITRFNEWIKDRIATLALMNDSDYVKFQSRHGRIEYFFTFNTAAGVIQKQKGDKASYMRNYLLACDEPLDTATDTGHGQAESNRDYQSLLHNALHDYNTHSGKRNTPSPQVKPHLNTRNSSHTMMCDALNEQRARLGKKTEESHYVREADMLSWLVWGMDCKSWLATRGLQGEMRYHLTANQLELLTYLERSNATLLDIDMAYPQRKEHLTAMMMRHLLRGIR